MSKAPVSPVGASRPEFRIDHVAINNEPVELDGTPTSPAQTQRRLSSQDGTTAEGKQVHQLLRSVYSHCSLTRTQDLANLISSRKGNPAVLVDLPETPQAEELAVSEATTHR